MITEKNSERPVLYQQDLSIAMFVKFQLMIMEIFIFAAN